MVKSLSLFSGSMQLTACYLENKRYVHLYSLNSSCLSFKKILLV